VLVKVLRDPSAKILVQSVGLSFLVAGCVTAQEASTPQPSTGEEAAAISSRVVDCEWKAAVRYDRDTYKVAQLAERVMGYVLYKAFKRLVPLAYPQSIPLSSWMTISRQSRRSRKSERHADKISRAQLSSQIVWKSDRAIPSSFPVDWCNLG
jgi:hypothetical protein